MAETVFEDAVAMGISQSMRACRKRCISSSGN
jgi:hypothetical protein